MTVTCDDEARRAIQEAIEAALLYGVEMGQDTSDTHDVFYHVDLVTNWAELARAIGDEELAAKAERAIEELMVFAIQLDEEAEEEAEEEDEDAEQSDGATGPQ